jgi:hypothetical protein
MSQVRSQVSPCEICCTQSGTGAGFPPSTSSSPVSIIPAMLHTSVHLHMTLTGRTNGRSLGTFEKHCCFGNGGGHWLENYFSLLYAVVWQAERCDRYGGTPSATTTSKGPVLSSKVQFKHLCRGTDVNSRSIVYCGLNKDRGLNTGPPVEAPTQRLRHCPLLLEIPCVTCSEASPRRAFVFSVFSFSELFPAV